LSNNIEEPIKPLKSKLNLIQTTVEYISNRERLEVKALKRWSERPESTLRNSYMAWGTFLWAGLDELEIWKIGEKGSEIPFAPLKNSSTRITAFFNTNKQTKTRQKTFNCTYFLLMERSRYCPLP
jgi:hypothetical protein